MVLVAAHLMILCGLWSVNVRWSSSGCSISLNTKFFMLMKLMIFLSSFVERKSSDFAALFSFESVVSIIFRSCSYKFCNVISIVEFIGEFAEIIASGY